MKQFFIFGASITYGVGGSEGGWADKLKIALQQKQYKNDCVERYELYNFARPGMIISEVIDSMDNDIKYRKHEISEKIIVISVGLNNVKAVGAEDNYISTKEAYTEELAQLLNKARQYTENVIFVGYTYVNEELINKRISPITNEATYFFNNRIAEFNTVCREICQEHKVLHIDLLEKSQTINWNEHLSKDGLHPNDRGHSWIYEQVWQNIKKEVE